MKIKDILAKIGNKVYTIRPEFTCYEAIHCLVKHNVGVLVITDDEDLPVGIISERDILRACSASCDKVMNLPVSEFMSKNLIIGLPDDDLDHSLGVMSKNGIRHLPIMSDRKIEGMISLRDLVDARLEETTYEVRYLKDYISGSLT